MSALLESEPLRAATIHYGRLAVRWAARKALSELRVAVQQSALASEPLGVTALAERIAEELNDHEAAALQPVFNATGILLHTGLGRAPLAAEAVRAIAEVSEGYCNVEIDLASGQRSQRSQAVAQLLCHLTGAEAAHLVNNNAGATALALAALAAGREVLVSHGQLIEIGGGFRLPDVIATFGARLRPVGTTNKTRVSDYAEAITEQTAAILVVHPSNYAITGFAQSPRLEDLSKLARDKGVPLIHDIGSGALIDFAQFGCPEEPVASQSIEAGADLVLFSGDKLLGGPQCGIIVGQGRLLESVVKHPLNRALRVDKFTLAALRATLHLYRQPEQALRSIPLLRMMNSSPDQLRVRAERLAARLRPRLTDWEAKPVSDEAFVGGGTIPDQAIPSYSVELNSNTCEVQTLADQLRANAPAVLARIREDKLLLCLHSILPEQDEPLGALVEKAAEKSKV
ncbi:MAG: L-seryl-tRNA(Sec) selenium transferase [Pirellulales bacterium]|nr:L-seryl-tRNA(Sec) selenium transferase [Pirellulales bacterium]